jgi:hypothetical protein
MMPRNLRLAALVFLLLGSTAAAQESGTAPDAASGEIGGLLRSFYFNLAHNDWEALTADILAAKVVAHRAPPKRFLPATAMLGAAVSPAARACSPSQSVSIENAVISAEGDWAEVSVPHCGPVVGQDEFRLIRFAGRWRFVAIHLFQQPVSVTAER